MTIHVPGDTHRPSLAERYAATRGLSEALASALSAEDQGVQSMPDASPTKWHLAPYEHRLRDCDPEGGAAGL